MIFLHSLQSEWLKTKRSAASWLCIIGGFFIPLIYLIVFIKDGASINSYGPEVNCWTQHFNTLWQNMAVFLLPMGLILTSSLITQVEFRNNSWKLLHTTPQSYPTVFLAKFSVVGLMTLKFFLFFNLGILITGYLPCWMFDGTGPRDPLPVMHLLEENARYFIACLPVMAFQFLISLNFKNFLVPVGIGFLGLIGSLIGHSWQYIVISPFAYTMMHTMQLPSDFNLALLALLYFVALMGLGFWLYITKKEKG